MTATLSAPQSKTQPLTDLSPAALVHEGARGPGLTLVGIADPQAQNGGALVSTVRARVLAASVAEVLPRRVSRADRA